MGIWRVVFDCVSVAGWHVAAVLEQVERLRQVSAVGVGSHDEAVAGVCEHAHPQWITRAQ